MHPTLRAAAEANLGLFRTADALAAGYSPSELRALCRSGSWVRLRRGVLTTAADLAANKARGRRHDVDCLAVVLGLGRTSALVSHGSAARLWELPTPRTLEPTIRLTDPDQWRRGPDYLMTCAPLSKGDRWRTGPLPLTSAARTLVDCAREWPLEDAVVAMDAALLAGRTTPEELRRAGAAAGHWRGGGRAARAVEQADGRAESPLETRGRLRLVGAGLPRPELQVEIHAGGSLVGVVDAWFEEAALALEFDGRIKYDQPWRGLSPERVLWEEKRREDELRALDIRVVRLTDGEVGPGWPRAERRLRELLAVSGPALRRFAAVPRNKGVRRTA